MGIHNPAALHYHIFMIYNNGGENWYIHGKDLWFPSIFNRIWFLLFLFVISIAYLPFMLL
jgi:hypothetical protein